MKKTWLGVAIIVLATGTVQAKPSACGFPGKEATIGARLVDCAKENPTDHVRTSTTSDAYLSLVARIESGIKDPEFYEVWRVSHPGNPAITGLLIGDLHEGTLDWEHAKEKCGHATRAEVLLPGVKWRLPTGDELAQIGRKNQDKYNDCESKHINGNGIWKELPNMEGNFFWSSSPVPYGNAWGLNGDNGKVGILYSRDHDNFSVRCAGR